jgi:hypothetical protein
MHAGLAVVVKCARHWVLLPLALIGRSALSVLASRADAQPNAPLACAFPCSPAPRPRATVDLRCYNQPASAASDMAQIGQLDLTWFARSSLRKRLGIDEIARRRPTDVEALGNLRNR